MYRNNNDITDQILRQTVVQLSLLIESLKGQSTHLSHLVNSGDENVGKLVYYDPLTPRQYEVLRLLIEDLTYAEIAKRLNISPHTVNEHVKAIYSKFGVGKRAAAVEVGRQRGYFKS